MSIKWQYHSSINQRSSWHRLIYSMTHCGLHFSKADVQDTFLGLLKTFLLQKPFIVRLTKSRNLITKKVCKARRWKFPHTLQSLFGNYFWKLRFKIPSQNPRSLLHDTHLRCSSRHSFWILIILFGELSFPPITRLLGLCFRLTGFLIPFKRFQTGLEISIWEMLLWWRRLNAKNAAPCLESGFQWDCLLIWEREGERPNWIS